MASSQPPPSAKPATAAMIGLRARETASQRARKSPRKASAKVFSRNLFYIGARRKGLCRTGKHDAAYAFIGLEEGKRRVDFADHLRIESVERLWAVEPQQRRTVVFLDLDRLVIHLASRPHPR